LITASERALLLKEIELLFGEKVMTGQIAGLYSPDASAGGRWRLDGGGKALSL
jgi:hypothetical protein